MGSEEQGSMPEVFCGYISSGVKRGEEASNDILLNSIPNSESLKVRLKRSTVVQNALRLVCQRWKTCYQLPDKECFITEHSTNHQHNIALSKLGLRYNRYVS